MTQYNNLVFAGTFDHLHRGHMHMLDTAFFLAQKVSIGITTEKMYRNKVLSDEIEKYTDRKKAVEAYVRKKNVVKRVRFFRLEDPLGPSVSNPHMDAILVSRETESGAHFINKIRKKRGMKPLTIHVVTHFTASDQKPITSERIRLGEIDREGNSYLHLFRKDLSLPEKLRAHLRIPLGTVIQGVESDLSMAAKKAIAKIKQKKPSQVITVGDITSLSFINNEFIPDVQIIDLRSRRKDMVSRKSEYRIQYENKPGTIQANAARAIEKAIRSSFFGEKKQTVVIKGEEDLLALPAILYAPLGSIVLYGQYDLGVVWIYITEAIKQNIFTLVKNFTAK